MKALSKCCNGCDAPVYAPSRVLCAECLTKLDAKIMALGTPRWDPGSLAKAIASYHLYKDKNEKEADAVQRLTTLASKLCAAVEKHLAEDTEHSEMELTEAKCRLRAEVRVAEQWKS
jgi:hypothetical protein